MAKFAANLRTVPLELVKCTSIAEAVAGAQIVTTATAVRGTRTVLPDSLVGPGVHVNAIGGDCPGKN
jgi:ornithine cyclodeaminase